MTKLFIIFLFFLRHSELRENNGEIIIHTFIYMLLLIYLMYLFYVIKPFSTVLTICW